MMPSGARGQTENTRTNSTMTPVGGRETANVSSEPSHSANAPAPDSPIANLEFNQNLSAPARQSQSSAATGMRAPNLADLVALTELLTLHNTANLSASQSDISHRNLHAWFSDQCATSPNEHKLLKDAALAKRVFSYLDAQNQELGHTDNPLVAAANYNDVEAINLMVSLGVPLEGRDALGYTAFLSAAAMGNISAMTALKMLGANVNAEINVSGVNALHACAMSGTRDGINYLLSLGLPVDGQTQNKRSALHLCVENGPEVAEALLEAGANVTLADETGMTPLHLAAQKSALEVANLFLENKDCNVNAQSPSGLTPLHVACIMGDADMVSALLSKGADTGINMQDQNGETAAFMAVQRNCPKILTLLQAAGADLSLPRHDKIAPLHLAASKGFNHLVERLIGWGVSPNQRTGSGATAAHLVATMPQAAEQLEMLNKLGANLNLADDAGFTPLHLTAENGLLSATRYLLSIPTVAIAPKTTAHQYTPLHSAMLGNHLPVARLLQKAGASLNDQTAEGETAAHLAVLTGHTRSLSGLSQEGIDFTISNQNGDTAAALAQKLEQPLLAHWLDNLDKRSDATPN